MAYGPNKKIRIPCIIVAMLGYAAGCAGIPLGFYASSVALVVLITHQASVIAKLEKDNFEMMSYIDMCYEMRRHQEEQREIQMAQMQNQQQMQQAMDLHSAGVTSKEAILKAMGIPKETMKGGN